MDSKKAGIIIVTAGIVLTLIAAVVATNRRPDNTRTAAFTGSDSVAVIHLSGPIAFSQDSSLLGGASSASLTMADLEKAEKDRSLKAVVLRIDSPGGSASASQELYDQVMHLKKSGKKVVASFGDTAASGGYFVGAAADKIVALPSTVTGSIGVISVVPNLEELYRMIGYKERVFKSGPHKDMLSAARPLTSEEEKIMQEITDDIYEDFINAVANGRGLPKEKVRQLADGRIYTGNQAKENGLVDELGGQREAVKLAAKLAGIEGEPQVVEYRRAPGFFNLLRGVQLFNRNYPLPLPSGYTTIKY